MSTISFITDETSGKRYAQIELGKDINEPAGSLAAAEKEVGAQKFAELRSLLEAKDRFDKLLEQGKEKKVKDRWDKWQIAIAGVASIATLSIGVAGIIFSISYNDKKNALETSELILHQQESKLKQKETELKQTELTVTIIKAYNELRPGLSSNNATEQKFSLWLLNGLPLPNNDTVALNELKIAFRKGEVASTPSDTRLQKDTSVLGQLSININVPDPANYWVYLGQKQSGKPFSPDIFNLKDHLPAIGETITAATAVYKRNNKPQEISPDKWKIGDVVGVLKEDKSIVVADTVNIDKEGNYWVRVKK